MRESLDSNQEQGDVVYSPKQAAVCFLIGAPLLYASTLLSGWLEHIVGGLGALLLVGTVIWLAYVVTNLLALAVEGEEFMEVIGVKSDGDSSEN